MAAVLAFALQRPLQATPQFARQYRVDCSYCHVAPPRLNQRGEDFLARGYRFDPLDPMPSHRTLPVAVWNTFDVEYRRSPGLTKAYPSRVEVISGGPIGTTRASYFIELRALSQQIGGGNRLLNRSGRFEDAFVNVAVNPAGSLSVTVGQFRALNQVDVSRRLSLSEPLAFSASISGTRPAGSSARLTALRAFSPSGRQPAVRLAYQRAGSRNAADGWYSAFTIPLTGELTIPLTDAASFEFEARPKGVFGESYYRTGMTAVGGHAFIGDDRSVAHLVASSDFAERWALLAAAGFDRLRGTTSGRFTAGAEYVVARRVIGGARIDHRTGPNRRPAVLLYVNGDLPFGPEAFRQAVRLQFEQTLQRNNFRSALALSHVF